MVVLNELAKILPLSNNGYESVTTSENELPFYIQFFLRVIICVPTGSMLRTLSESKLIQQTVLIKTF
jgi:hypothetical protein